MLIPLHDYQIYAKDFVLTHPYCGLFLDTGLGKSGVILEALYELNPNMHILIIAPKTVAKCTWVNEIRKWHAPFRTQSLIVNEKGKEFTKKARENLYDSILSSPPTVYFVNRDKIPALVKYFTEKYRTWPFGIVIIDESQSFKSYSAERFKALKRVRPYIFRMALLSGSPAPKSLEDLWSQIYLLDMGQRLGKTITSYREAYFNPGMIVNNHPVEWRVKPGMDNVIYQRISDIVISMKNTKLALPPLTFNDMEVEMDPPEMDRYKQFMKTNILTLSSGKEIEAANAAVLSAKLSQMASGAIYTMPHSHEYEKIHEHKLEMCQYIIENTDDNIIIAYHFKSDLEMLTEYLGKAGHPVEVFDGSPEMEDRWNNGQIPVMLLQPASNGAGVNLQHGGHTLIWYTLPWSLEHYDQTNARIYRQGQTQPVIIHRIMTKKTIDRKILQALELKDISQQRLLDAIEATINDGTED